jgi:hypothetical protein
MKNIKYLTSENNGSEVLIYATVESSTLKSVYWSNIANVNGVIRVLFTNGKRYRYDGVSSATFMELITAESVGKKFNEIIKGKYEYELVDGMRC